MTRTEDDDLPAVDFRFLLKLRGSMLNAFMDRSFQWDAEELIQKRMKKEDNKGLIYRAQNPGIAHIYCGMAIDRYFKDLSDYGYLEKLNGYYDVFNDLEILQAAWSLLGGMDTKIFDALQNKRWALLDKNDEIADVERWTDLCIKEGVPLMEKTAATCRASREYKGIRKVYASALADSVLHDRQLCAFISHKLLRLAPYDKKTKKRKKFVNRVRWPAHVPRIVWARDRGKCSNCHIDIAMELLAKPNIDHIFPIAIGGCNDIVNLQLLCAECNLEKGSRTMDVITSIPTYSGKDYVIFGDMF